MDGKGKKRLLLVVNPISGKKLGERYLPWMIERFGEAGWAVSACCTQKEKNAHDIVLERGADFELIVCVGGDGTLKETVWAAIDLGADAPIGYVPLGATNDFARSMDLPVNGVEAAVEAIIAGEPRSVDMGRFNSENFIYVAGFGNFTALSYTTNQKLKNILGRNAYYLRAVKDLFKMHGYPARVEADGEFFEGDYFYGALSNSYSIGGMPVLHNAGVEFDDGLFELVLVRMFKNPADALRLAKDMLRKSVPGNPLVTIRHCRRVKFMFGEATDFTLDGEFGGSHTEVEACALRRPVRIVVRRGDREPEEERRKEKAGVK